MGRREQLVALDDAVRRAGTGLPQFVVFSGAAGIGKARLMTHFTDWIEQTGSSRPASGSCTPAVWSSELRGYHWSR